MGASGGQKTLPHYQVLRAIATTTAVVLAIASTSGQRRKPLLSSGHENPLFCPTSNSKELGAKSWPMETAEVPRINGHNIAKGRQGADPQSSKQVVCLNLTRPWEERMQEAKEVKGQDKPSWWKTVRRTDGEQGMKPLRWDAEGLLASPSVEPTTHKPSQGLVREGPSSWWLMQQKSLPGSCESKEGIHGLSKGYLDTSRTLINPGLVASARVSDCWKTWKTQWLQVTSLMMCPIDLCYKVKRYSSWNCIEIW